MNNTLYLFVGKSGSGKSTIAEILENKYGYNVVESYTTRCPRYYGERGHIFLSNAEYNELQNIVASTEYNGNKYCTTKQMLDECNIYPIDIPGIKTLLERYNTDRKIVIFYFSANICTRIHRMIDRGDSDMAIISRLLQDEKEDWHDQLNDVIWQHRAHNGGNVHLYDIYADDDLMNVVARVERCMEV